jgi:prepilin signal peptidase PulO-like enzyme (type II secretory pathway)
LCTGSFLNAVIYRLPRGKSLTQPLWSACPFCRSRIAWYDNLPILSFLRLRGRCRHCDVPIPTRYLVIEVLMAIIVLVLLDAFFIGNVRAGLSRSQFGFTDQLSFDWPILVAHIILFACLLALSAIDLEHYWVDIRFTNFVTIAGLVLHTLWTPRHSAVWPRPSDAVAMMSLCAVAGLLLTWIVLMCQPLMEMERLGEAHTDESETGNESAATSHEPSSPPPSLSSPSRMGGWIALVLGVALLVNLFLSETGLVPLRHTGRALVPLAFLFLLVLSQSIVSRESDAAIAAALEEESVTARRTVMSEFLLFVPAIAFGALGVWLASGDRAPTVSAVLHKHFHPANLALFRDWAPLEGLATAASGYVIAGALGWAVRIFFTLMFGREAFGTGDIHMMAAAGSVAGWPVVVLGFFLTCGLALAGWLLALPFKRTRALPLGPWLSLGFLTVVVFYDAILRLPVMARAIETANWFLGDGRRS